MFKWNRKIIISLGTIITVAVPMGSIISCSTNGSGIVPNNNGKYAYTIYFKDGTHKDVSYDEFLKYLANHRGTSTTTQIGFDNQLIKYLYKKEQAASVIANEKDSSVAKLTAYDDVYKDASKSLANDKKAIQSQYGTNWQSQWNKALLSNKYGGATSEDQAIEYLAVQKMKSDALRRYTLKIDTTTYRARNIGDDNFKYLTTANAIPDKTSKYAIALITNSFDDTQKDPMSLLHSYLDKYKTLTVLRHILYALKAGKKPTDDWTITKNSLLKMFTVTPTAKDPTRQIWEQLASLQNKSTDWLGNNAPASNIAKVNSDDGSEGKANGSLGISTWFDSLNNLVPGFIIPLALNAAKKNFTKVTFDAPTKVAKTWDLNAIASKVGILSTGQKRITSADQINGMTDLQLTKFSNEMRDALVDTKNKNIRPLYMTVSDTNANPANPNPVQVTFSSDGLHTIYEEQTNEFGDPKAIKANTLLGWVQNDLTSTKDSLSLQYNVVKSVNDKMQPDDNLTSAVNDFFANKTKSKYFNDFFDYVKTQTNYMSGKHFTDDDVRLAKTITDILATNKNESAILKLQKKYQDWWDTNVTLDKFVDPGSVKFIDIKNMIRSFGGTN